MSLRLEDPSKPAPIDKRRTSFASHHANAIVLAQENTRSFAELLMATNQPHAPAVDPVKLDRLAEVAVKVGLRLEPGQDLFLPRRSRRCRSPVALRSTPTGPARAS